jgi:hypothetical protein
MCVCTAAAAVQPPPELAAVLSKLHSRQPRLLADTAAMAGALVHASVFVSACKLRTRMTHVLTLSCVCTASAAAAALQPPPELAAVLSKLHSRQPRLLADTAAMTGALVHASPLVLPTHSHMNDACVDAFVCVCAMFLLPLVLLLLCSRLPS